MLVLSVAAGRGTDGTAPPQLRILHDGLAMAVEGHWRGAAQLAPRSLECSASLQEEGCVS
jgi:hypothetical protein